MDPITRAARSFLAEADAFFRAGKGPILPMIAGAAERMNLIKTLRLGELALENRRPLFVYEEPFSDERSWGEGLAAVIVEDYEAVRQGAAKEGVELAPFPAAGGFSEKDPPLARAVWTMERAGALLAERLDGALVAIVPKRIEDAKVYRNAIVMLANTRVLNHIRLAVHCAPDGPLDGALGDEGARFHVDQDELTEHLKNLGGGGSGGASGCGGSAGPPEPPKPSLTEEQKKAFEAETGRRLARPEIVQKLRASLIEGATAAAKSKPIDAAAHYRDAKALCEREGLKLEEAMVLLALGGACLAASAKVLAVDAYELAADRARGLEAWSIVCQAKLGVGGAELAAGQFEAAALAYRAAADAAKKGKTVILGVEALRMEGTCHLLRGAKEDAARAWQDGVDLGADLSAKERAASTFPEVAKDLTALLERLGLRAQAAHVKALAEASPLSPTSDVTTLPARDGALKGPALPFISPRFDEMDLNSTIPAMVSPFQQVLPFVGGPAAPPIAAPPIASPKPAPPASLGVPADAMSTLPVGVVSPFARALPFTAPSARDSDSGATTLRGGQVPTGPVLPFESDDDAEPREPSEPRRS